MCRHRKRPVDPGDRLARWAAVIGAAAAVAKILMDLVGQMG